MKGFLNGDKAALLCGDKSLTEEKQSEFFPASLKANQSKRVMDEETFREFLDYSVFVARQASGELKEGFVKPTPYAKTCETCKYGGMCGFQKEEGAERAESTIDAPTIANITRAFKQGEQAKEEKNGELDT